jgi:hypothetical protein
MINDLGDKFVIFFFGILFVEDTVFSAFESYTAETVLTVTDAKITIYHIR